MSDFDYFTAIQYPVGNIQGDNMAGQVTQQYTEPSTTPLVATVAPDGTVTITHANDVDPQTGAPIYNINHAEAGPFDGSIAGIPIKYLALGALAYFLLGRK